MLFLLVRYYTRFCVPLKRMEAASRSPIFSHLTSTMQGLSLIRCHGIQEQFAAKMEQLLDAHGRLYKTMVSCDRWLNIRVILISSCLLAAVLYLSIGLRDVLTPGIAALSIVYAMSLINQMQYSAVTVSRICLASLRTTHTPCVAC